MAVPKYQQVATILRKRIALGTYAPHEMIPDQKALAKEFAVSRLTVKKALDGLEREGLIFKRSGMGTFVLENPLAKHRGDSPANFFSGLTAQQGKEHITNKIIDFSVVAASPAIASKLSIQPRTQVYEFRRLRLRDGHPFIIEHTYIPVYLAPRMVQDNLDGSLYTYLKDELNLKFGGSFRKIAAMKADERDVKYLNAKPDDPMLAVEQITWLTTGEYIEYSISKNVYNTRSYTMLDLDD